MMTVYNSEVDDAAIAFNFSRLKNQIFHLLPCNEEGEDWLKPLNTIILEVAGILNLFPQNVKIFELLSKLEGLKAQGKEIEFQWFRRIIFECCSLAQVIENSFNSQERKNVIRNAQN